MPFFEPRRPAYQLDPYPVLARLQAEAPVFRAANLEAWVVTRYADCSQVLHDGACFTPHPELTTGPRAEALLSHRSRAPFGGVLSLGTATRDAHRRLRAIVNPLFAPAAARESMAEIEHSSKELADNLPLGEPFDLMDRFANPLPKQVILSRLGLPRPNDEGLRDLLAFVETVRSVPRPDEGAFATSHAALRVLGEALSPAATGAAPEGSVLAALHAASSTGAIATDEAISVLAHIAAVGSDPTAGAIGNAIAALAAQPVASQRLRDDPTRTRTAVYELLRFDSPTHIVTRFAAADTVLGGRRIHRGETVFAVIGAANRDPAEFDAPGALDLDRDARRQLAFGQGEHVCLGASLAVSIVQAALQALLRRFRHIEIVESPQYSPAVEFRIPDRLMVRCE